MHDLFAAHVPALLDHLEVAICVFDEGDRAVIWNDTFLRFFPEHAGHVHVGEHYRDNLIRFYRQRLDPHELPFLDAHVASGIERHRSQTRPFSFDHRGYRLRVAACDIAGVGRARTWTRVSEAVASPQVQDPLTASPAVPFDTSTMDRTFADALPNGHATLDAEGRILAANHEFHRLYGLDAATSLVGVAYVDLVARAWRVTMDAGSATDRIPACLHHVREAMRFPGAPFEVPLPDDRWVCVLDQPGEHGSRVSVHFDVTALKRETERARAVEAALRTQSQLLHATVEHIDQGLIVFDAEGIAQLVNERAIRLLDLSPAMARAKPRFRELVEHQRARGETIDTPAEADLWPLLRQGAIPCDYERVRPNGTALSVRTVFLPSGGALRSYTDVTEAHRHAAAQTRAKETAEVARRAAEAANSAKTEFLATMSHEIRTPLNGIIGYTDLLLDGSILDAAQRQQVERIASAGAALLTVVNDILDFSKIEAGQVDLDPRSFALRDLIDGAASIVRASAERKGLLLRVEVDPRLPVRLVGDEDRLRQVLLNLLNNAVKFTPSGAVSLIVGAGPNARAEVVDLRVAVIDTGIGIAADKQHRLFERFSQVDGSIRREFGGTGLGLAITQRLVVLMGGTITVESAAGQGTVFHIALSLPRIVETQAVHAEGGVARAFAGTGRILVVDDIAINRDLAQAVLTKAGYEIDAVDDGADAVMAVQANAYDLILMDVQMPGMDGLTATQHIRDLGGTAIRLPIIAMTANVLPAQVARFRAAGMSDHVGKPFRQVDLLSVVAHWIARESSPTSTIADGAGALTELDEAILADVTALLGVEAAGSLLRQVARDLRERFEPANGGDRARVIADAHALASGTGAVGFRDFAAGCQDLEALCASGAAYEATFHRLLAARKPLLAEIERRTALSV